MQGLTTTEHRDLILSVGTHRRNRRLSPLEVAELIQKAIEHGTSRVTLSSEIGVGTSQIGTFLKLLALAPEVRHLAGWGSASPASIPFSSLAELRRLSVSEQVQAVKAILSEQLAWKEVVEVVQIANRSGKDVTKCVVDVVRRRPQSEKRHVFMGKIDQRTKCCLGELNQRERDLLFHNVLAAIVGPGGDFETRLGVEIFTVVTIEPILSSNGMDPDQFERVVNTRIQEVQRSCGLPA